MSYPYDLDDKQDEVERWNNKNFPNKDKESGMSRCLIGAMEELGELSHAHLKGLQGIRGTQKEHETKAKDAIGDIAIFLMAYCAKRGFSFQDCIRDAWDEVSKRDWR
ncbi:MAG: hypothetical protein E2O29_01560 [Deltaproteobacteria bacterium]|nr:MAG: hypothetical protein E2O29_01560 [Deltaproteobacteria bacterium]